MEHVMDRIPQDYDEDLKITAKIVSYTMTIWLVLYLVKDMLLG